MSNPYTFDRSGNHNRINLLIVLLNTTEGIRPIHIGEIGKFPGPLQNIELMLRGVRADAETQGISEVQMPFPSLPDNVPFRYFDWSLTELSPSLQIAELPMPGVLIALCDALNLGELASMQLFHIRAQLQKDTYIKDFLLSPDSRAEPVRIYEHDVFISYTQTDSDLANELQEQLVNAQTKVFLAERSISLASLWEPAIRRALQRSRLLIVLITPHSIKSDWVIFEAGAAWALDVPIAAATQYVQPSDMPAALPNYQSHPYVTEKQRADFLEAVLKIVHRQHSHRVDA